MKTGHVVTGLLMLVVLTLQQDRREAFRQWRKGILAEHNKYRRMARKGEIPCHPAASKMPMLKWDRKLTIDAVKWSRICKMEHDYSTEDGENLAYDTNKLNSAVLPWFMEYKHYVFGPLPEQLLPVVTHYTQIVWANTTKLGCFKRLCPSFEAWGRSVENAYFTVCRYSPKGNWQGDLPYIPKQSRVQTPLPCER
ncbi:hypothetical protein PHET_09340 [Paragonimus heterotremus]|uniref:SCP domain-containing protein n=1 Tax=Paragonimus heterotremus TaxID=100268 RepID=A0A8J4SK95_9TREM|nr:hypothetical protein PHET_09340 [Paragonimus heterotremus]